MWTNLRSSTALWFKRLQPLAVLSVLLLSNSASAKTSSKGQALNVVFMLADDLGWAELGSYGQQKIPTPHLDRLASQGMRFTRHYSGAPVCGVSRDRSMKAASEFL